MWFIAGWGRAVGGGRGVQVCPNPNSEEGNEGVWVAGWGRYIREDRKEKYGGGECVWGNVGQRAEGWWSSKTLWVDWQFVRRQVLQRSLGTLSWGWTRRVLGFPDTLPLLSLSVTVTPMIVAVYPSCTLALIIFSSCISPLFCLSLPLLAALIGMNQFLKL